MTSSQRLPPTNPFPGRAGPWLRLGAGLAFLMLCILVPFALWGDAMDRSASVWLGRPDQAAWIAAVGIALLVADVLLPVPGSVVGMALCWALGPVWGGASIALGLTLSFAFGYALGRSVPEQRLRHWVGQPLWDGVRQRARHQALWWIVVARPLPLLAEMSALLAGVWRVPAPQALLMAGLSSCGTAALYAGSTWLGMNAPGLAATLAATAALPVLTWGGHRLVVRRLRSRGGPDAPDPCP